MTEVEIKVSSRTPLEDSELVERYKQANLSYKEEMYLEVLALMRKHHAKVGIGDWAFSGEMHEVLTSTPVEILLYQSNNKGIVSYSMDSFNLYKEYYLKIIQSVIHSDWDNMAESERAKINTSMYNVFAALKPFSELHSRYPKADISPYDLDSNLNSKYQNALKKFNDEIKEAKSLILKFFPTGEKLLEIFFRLKMNFNFELNQKAEEIKRDLEENKKINEKTKELVTEGTIQKEAENFNNTANSHRCRAILSIVGAFALAVLAFGWVVLTPIMGSSNGCEDFLCKFFNLNIRSFIFASGLFATMIYACLRSYFANSQNEVSNRQRFNAMNSYELLYSVADNKEDKNFIMQKAVECAYSHQPTGFVKQQKDNENPQQTFNIIPNLEKVTRTATDKPSGRSGAE